MKLNPENLHEFASLYALGGLSAADMAAFEEHLQTCEECGRELRSYENVAAALGASSPATPPAHLRDKLIDRVLRTPRTPGAVLNHAGLWVARPEELPWKRLGPGVDVKLLYRDEARKYNTCLVRMEPGTRYPSHRHAEAEEIYLISGDLHLGDDVMYSGDYCRADSHSIHGETFTNDGCLFLQMGSSNDEILR